MVFFNPITGWRLKPSADLPEVWTCSYEEALGSVEELSCDGVAFLLTHHDPYHVTVLKSGEWLYRRSPSNYIQEKECEVIESVLDEHNTLALTSPTNRDLFLVGRAVRPSGRLKKCGFGEESYDGGWDDNQRKYTPKFIPFSDCPLDGYDRAITDVQELVDGLPERKSRSKSRAPAGVVKKARVAPVADVPSNIDPIISMMKAGTWEYELSWDPAEGSVENRPARSPHTGEKILWAEEHFERTRELWGSYRSAHQAFEASSSLEGVVLLIEPDQRCHIDGVGYHPVFFDLDDCRDPENGEVAPWAMTIIEKLGTYTELSPSGKGIRCIGLMREPIEGRMSVFYTPDSQRFVPRREIQEGEVHAYHRIEVYGGGSGGRHLITFTGNPISGYDVPPAEVETWLRENCPLSGRVAGQGAPPPSDEKVSPVPLSDQELLKRIASSKDGPLMERLMAGDPILWTGEGARYPSMSEADLGLFRKLAYYTRGDKDRIERVALSSNMKRRRWSRTYLDRTIDTAVESCGGEFYDGSGDHNQEFLGKCVEVWMDLLAPRERLPFEAMLVMAHRHGNYTREGYTVNAHGEDHKMPDSGIWFFASHRDLGLLTGVDEVTEVYKIRKPILESGLVIKISEGTGSKGTLYLIPETRIEDLLRRVSERATGAQDNIRNRCVSFYVGVDGGTSPEGVQEGLPLGSEVDPGNTQQKLAWIKTPAEGRSGLNPTQKLVLELVLYGRVKTITEVKDLLGRRKDKVKSGLINPLTSLGLLRINDGEHLEIPENFGVALHSIFVESGAEEALRAAQAKFEKERHEHRLKGAEANHERSMQNIEAVLAGELDWEKLSPWEYGLALRRRDFETMRSLSSRARASA